MTINKVMKCFQTGNLSAKKKKLKNPLIIMFIFAILYSILPKFSTCRIIESVSNTLILFLGIPGELLLKF